MVGIVDMFLMQTGLEATEILRQVETFEPMLESIKRFKENYGFLTEIQWKISWRFCHSFSNFWPLAAACLAGVDLDFRAFLEPKGFLSTLCETRFNLVTTGADLQDPMPSELAKMYHETNFITVGPLLQQAKFCLTEKKYILDYTMLQVCRKIARER